MNNATQPSAAALRSAIRRRGVWMRLHDDWLYDLCGRHPGHARLDEVFAKVSLIGRSYQTGIERKITSHGEQAGALTRLALFIRQHHREVDAIVRPLRALRGHLDARKARLIIEAHGRLVSLLGRLLRDGQSSRSFCSKYLHFHCPMVPIYDSVVTGRIPGLVRWNGALDADLAALALPPGHDEWYAWYVTRFLRLYGPARQRIPGLKVKDLDYYLLTSG